jgi:tetratricopeptide (TPR) repeat protein
MAILPRTLLTQPAPAAVAAVTLFGLTVLGTTAHQTMQQTEDVTYRSACAELADSLGDRASWSELSWARYARCFEAEHAPRMAITAAADGLTWHPYSEQLFNIKGYNEIQIGEHEAAAQTLELGLERVQPTNGVMENNLAWTYLYLGDGGDEDARRLYQNSLEREPGVCESLHTGLFVEFEIARNTEHGIARAEALKNFQSLRNRYVACENRDTEWNTMIEAVGASVLYSEMETMLDSAFRDAGAQDAMREAVQTMRSHHPQASIAVVCDEAMPLADLRDECVKGIDHAGRLERQRMPRRLNVPCKR